MGPLGPGEQQTAITCILMSSIYFFFGFIFTLVHSERVHKCSFARVRTKPLPLE